MGKTLGHYKTFNCQTCGDENTVWVTPSAIKQRKKYLFCSRKCANARQSKPVKCGYCEKMFNSQKGACYCSRECFALSTRGRKAKNAHPNHIQEYIQSHYPNSNPVDIAEALSMTVSAVRGIAYKFGLKIAWEVKRQNIKKATAPHMQGANNPNWQGGGFVSEWGENWTEQRRAARKRDDCTCQVCGFYSRSIHIHHIKPRRLFLGHVEDANVLSNLISLCSKHHILVEMGKIPCPLPKS